MSAVRDDRLVGFDFFQCVELSGEAGRAWNIQFRDLGYLALRDSLVRALQLLHRRQQAEARELLEEVSEKKQTLSTEDVSMQHVLGRWFHGIWAYYHYLVGNLDRASSELDKAQESIARAIAEREFLISLAWHCTDLRIQQARVERIRSDWAQVARNLEHVRRMMFGESPFCGGENGKPITFENLAKHFSDLDLNADERSAIANFFDEQERLWYVEHCARQIYSPPGLVIQYP